MKEIEIIAGRKRFTCTNLDIIISNGTIIWLETQRYFKNSRCPNSHPIISKTEFNRLKKLGVLKKSEKNGLEVYNFCIQ